MSTDRIYICSRCGGKSDIKSDRCQCCYKYMGQNGKDWIEDPRFGDIQKRETIFVP